MNTIKELNKKIWYRIIKVIYILFFLFIIIFGTIIVYDIIKSDIRINQKDFKTLTEDEFFNKVRDVINKPENKDINETEMLYRGFKEARDAGYTIEGYDMDKEIKELENYLNKQQQPTYQQPTKIIINPWESVDYEKEKYNYYITFLIGRYYKLILFYLISYLLFFQIINRVFYYIVFGKINPNND